MKYLLYLLLITFYSCDINKDNTKLDNYIESAQVTQDNKYTILGGEAEFHLLYPNIIDSVRIVRFSDSLDDFNLTCKENVLISNTNKKVGNFGFAADLYSNGKIYELKDTMKIRKPRVVFENKFGYFFISNIDNKFSISVPGFIDDEINIEINCEYSITNDSTEPKTYIIHPEEEESIIIRVYLKMKNGNKIMFPKYTFPVINKNTRIQDLIIKQ